MPLTLVLLAVCALVLFPSLTVAECFLLAAVLSPTDPVVTSTVVTATRVPALVRHTLNLESGMNDGLALPFVLFFLTLAEPGGDAARSAVELLGEVAFGAFVGLVIAFVAGHALRRLPGGGLARNYEGVYALGLALAAYGFADATIGNGLIAAFVAGLALGVAEHDIPKAFAQFNESISAVLQVGVFFIFGALIVTTGWDHGVLPLIGFIVFALVVARPAAVLASMAGARLSPPVKLFVAWFGPKGVASMLFALLVLRSQAPDAALVFEIASFAIVASILVHGLTETVGTRWIEERA
jgi:sodium/hydrogen antiporter